MSRKRQRHPIQDLRTAIDCLPIETRVAMLVGVRSNDIIVGAYTDRRGGVCPMLAAHRCGGRTDLLSFSRAWDRFARAGKRSRRATDRELRILTTHLEASLLAEGRAELDEAIADHHRLIAQRPNLRRQRPEPARRERPGDRDRMRELSKRHGWSWLRPFRRLDDYERARARVEAKRDALATRQHEEDRTPVGV
jgi:hypothetical protein